SRPQAAPADSCPAERIIVIPQIFVYNRAYEKGGDKMYRIIFATGNAGKMKEIREILSDLGAEILSMKEAGIRADIVEDGNTFEENALIKAKAVAALLPEGSNTAVLADDSGLEIDYLDGEPGIYSARYMGEDTSYRIKNA